MALALAVLIVLAQAATGAFWWRLARGPSVRVLEAAGMGLALGSAAATLSGVLLVGIAPAGWGWAAPTVVTVIAAPILLSRRPGLLRTWRPTPWRPALVALVISGGLGLASIAVNLRNYPLESAGTITTYHPDMTFFEALSTSLARLGPSDSIFMAGAELRYHWFSYAWAGQVAQAAATEPFVVLTRLLPVVALAGSVLIAVSWTQRLTKGFWAPSVAGVLIVFGGYVGATYGTILNFDSPSQALATVWMLALCFALLGTLGRRATRPRVLAGLLAVVALLSVATTAGKVNSAAVVVAGWGLVALVALLRREPWTGRAWLALGFLAAASGIAYVAWISGPAEADNFGVGTLLNKASSVQGLNPSQASWGIVAGTLILAIAMLPRWAGVAWLVASVRSRWQPFTVLSVGTGAAGILALLLLSGGMNDSWFALSASAPLSVASAVGLSRAVRATAPGRGWRPAPLIVVAMGCGVALAAVVLVLWSFGPDRSPTLRWLGPLVAVGGAIALGTLLARRRTPPGARRATGLALTLVILVAMAGLGRVLSLGAGSFAVQPETGFSPSEFSPFEAATDAIDQQGVNSWSPAQVGAAAWLRQHVGDDGLVATNIAFGSLVPALSGRTMYVSEIRYLAKYGRASRIDDMLAREEATWSFVESPSAATATPLCEAGVDALWVDPDRTSTRDWAPWAAPVITADDVIVLALDPSAC
ncbi:MAG: hypothetical protein Q8M17_10895 [Actinomycetota bacterium]|nr:hypothetical protein [Actinomycetota bacterium]